MRIRFRDPGSFLTLDTGWKYPDPRHCRGMKTPIIHFNWTRIVHRHRIDADPDPNFYVDANPDPQDPDWHQNDANPTQSFTHVGKS